MKRDLISLHDYTSAEIEEILTNALQLKTGKTGSDNPFQGKSFALIFQKPSNRTRVSFEVGIRQLGGHCLYLGPDEINLGKRESTEDVARTLSRYLNGLVARTFKHQDVMDLARHASVPVINGLSDLFHPCQALADILSIREKFGSLKGRHIAYVGDGNNVCHSLLLACAKTGAHLSIATPQGYEPQADIVEQAKEFAQETGSRIELTRSPQEAVRGTDVIYADVWVSMGQETESQQRLEIFRDYQVNEDLIREANPDYIFMHCLPAHRGQEVTAGIIDGEHSIVFDQAENRMHVQKAVLLFLMSHI